MTPQHAAAILQFLARTTLKGNEAQYFMECWEGLSKIATEEHSVVDTHHFKNLAMAQESDADPDPFDDEDYWGDFFADCEDEDDEEDEAEGEYIWLTVEDDEEDER